MSYLKSEIYKLGFQLAISTEGICRAFPRHEQFCLGRQLRSSSRSIVANYVEGYVRQGLSKNDHMRFMVYSQGSCDETKFWLELAKALNLAEARSVDQLLEGYRKLGKLIHSVLWKNR